MRRYATNAVPDDPGVWSDVSDFFPTNRGTYEPAPAVSISALTATGETGVKYAYCARTLTGTVSYVVGEVKIWQYTTTLTDRTNGRAIGASPHMAQYGTVTVCAMGAAVGTPTIYATGGNFADLTGAPSAEIAVVSNGAVLLLNYYSGGNTYNDGWWASDIGDYTTWTPASGNEAANGRLLDSNGAITAACVMGGHVYAFKADAIYRGTYVGRPVIWQWELVERGVGALNKYLVLPCGDKILYVNAAREIKGDTSNLGYRVMMFDGIRSVCVNEEVAFASGMTPSRMVYDSAQNMAYIMVDITASFERVYAFNLTNGLWGRSRDKFGGYDSGVYDKTAIMMMGDGAAIRDFLNLYSLPPIAAFYCVATEADVVKHQRSGSPSTDTERLAYVQTSYFGKPDRKTLFDRLTPLLVSRSNRSGATSPTVTLTVNTYTERHDTAAATTATISESSQRKRFDFAYTNGFARFKLNFTDVLAEVEDVLASQLDAGRD